MFTGIVREVAVVESAAPRLRIRSREVARDLHVDDSVSVSGACLTIVAREGDAFDEKQKVFAFASCQKAAVDNG